MLDFLRCIPLRCVQELIAMLSSPANLSIAVSLAMLLTSSLVSAQQEGVPPMPDATYGTYSYQSPTDLPMPQPDDLSNPNTVTIPIPGGGDITVDGPTRAAV